jgi:hypothetical protein
MASTFSPSLRLELIGDGDQSGIWGQTTNNNLGTLVEQAIAGVITINILDANYTLTNFNGVADEARNAVITITGTLSQQRNIIAPLADKVFTFRNSTTGGFSIQVIGSSGTGVVIPNGATTSIYCDGTNFLPLNTGAAGNFSVSGNLSVTGTTTLTGALSGSTATFSGAVNSTNSVLSGTPTAPTAAAGTNTTQIATTAFAVANGFPSGGIIMWSGSIASIPTGFVLCNGSSGTPDLRDRFVVGAGSTYAVAATGGTANAVVVSHSHSFAGNALGDHSHNMSFHQTSKSNNATPFMLSSPINGENLNGTLTLSTTNSSAGTPSGTISTEGVSGTNQNLPPYYALAFIMKL